MPAWEKLGRITTEPASYPTVDWVDGKPRLYFARRNDKGQSGIHFMTLNPDNPLEVEAKSDQPLLELGPPGTFDADGHAARCVVDTGSGKLMYLIGWNRSQAVPYHLSIGCARSLDGKTWTKLAGPVLDRNVDEPFLCTSPCVMFDNGLFRMWYCGGLGWQNHDGKLEPIYRIHHAESQDGLTWRRTPHVCIDTFPGGDAIGWPVVWKDESGSGYQMVFSYRGGADYRDNPDYGYRLGYATSADGLDWQVEKDGFGLDRSPDSWDSIMIAYVAMDRDLVYYNGNGFGATGIGVARRVRDSASHRSPSSQ